MNVLDIDTCVPRTLFSPPTHPPTTHPPQVLTPSLAQTVAAHQPWFILLHISDQNSKPVGYVLFLLFLLFLLSSSHSSTHPPTPSGHPFVPPVVLRAQFLVPTTQAEMATHLRPLLLLFFSLLDDLATKVKLNEEGRKR